MFSEDLSVFFDPAQLADEITVDGVTVPGIFSRPFGEVLNVEDAPPTVQVEAALVPSIARGQIVTRGAETFVVAQYIPDETGRVLELVLEVQ